jgi:hypothetical protein
MSGETLIIIELTMTAGLCLGFGFYQLWSLRQDKKRTLAARQLASSQLASSQLAAEKIESGKA